MESLSQIINTSSAGIDSTFERSGVKSISNKIINLQLLDSNDMTNIIVLLLAIITIIVVVFYLPRLNKNASLEKAILDNILIKIIFCCVLLYGFYHYSLKMFGIVLLITFFLFWFHNGYSVEKYGPVNMMNVGSTWENIVNIFGKQDEVSEKEHHFGIDVVGENEKKEEKEDDESDDEEDEEEVKEVEKEKINEVVAENDDVFNGFSNNSSEMYQRQQQIFDQRDFMILPEMSEERAQIFNRICDDTICRKPSSFVEKEY